MGAPKPTKRRKQSDSISATYLFVLRLISWIPMEKEL
jgi:hypothetical protein